ncbi:uromodulin-like [Xenopus laevis]|uniref:Uromodulin n=1 Tax=Xenopus laevis TaxID=8355 RepID=A0A8J1LU48_XENLA|nr:uromodulin-like [Xenopus laevis]
MTMPILLALLISLLASDRSHAQTSSTIVKSSSSLTYLVDTTGSMYDDLQQLKLVNDWLLDSITARFPYGVRQYTMVEFNDPTFGPVRKTSSIDEFKAFFNNLYAYDGGDCPELAMNGLKLALENSPPGSFILVLTDASSKDYTNTALLNNIRSLINAKQSQVVFLITGLCAGLNDPAFLIYRDIASLSYGHVFQIGLSDLGKVFNYLDFTLSRPDNSTVKVFYQYYNGINHCDNFTVTHNFTTLLVITDGPITSIRILGPGSRDPNPKTIVSEIWGSLYEMNKPAQGAWTLCITSSSPHAIQVEGLTVTNTSVTEHCSDCHPNAKCDVYSDFYQCTCDEGYVGDGFSCSDIDECAYSWLYNCSYGYCENTNGSYDCVCPAGYTKGAGNNCVDINECSSPDLNKCHSSATCINYVGTYTCQCPPGVYGDGKNCEIDPCTRGVCGNNNECTTDGRSYSCSDPCVSHTVLDEPWRSTANAQSVDFKCDTDKMGWYRFNGSGGIRMPETCVAPGSCNTNAPMWLNGSHPTPTDGIVNLKICAHWSGDCCLWSTTIQVKTCPGGYHLYKLNRTPACSLAYCTDPTSLNDDCLCTDDEQCRFVSGSYGCYCKDNRTISAFTDLKPTVSCGLKNMITSFRKCELRALKIDVKNIVVTNSDCFNVSNNNTTNTYSVLAPLQEGKCGMKLTVSDAHTVYCFMGYSRLPFLFQTNTTHASYVNSFEFIIVLPGNVVRDKLITTSTCVYPLDMRHSLFTALNPIISTVNLYISDTGEFKAYMGIYKNDDYKNPYEGTQVDIYTKTVIYIGVFLDGPDTSQYAMVLKNCYATPSSNADDSTKYYIIQNSCPSVIDDTVNVAENGLSSQARFSFQMFAFLGDVSQVYLHCEIYVCDNKATTCLPRQLGGRHSKRGCDLINEDMLDLDKSSKKEKSLNTRLSIQLLLLLLNPHLQLMVKLAYSAPSPIPKPSSAAHAKKYFCNGWEPVWVHALHPNMPTTSWQNKKKISSPPATPSL